MASKTAVLTYGYSLSPSTIFQPDYTRLSIRVRGRCRKYKLFPNMVPFRKSYSGKLTIQGSTNIPKDKDQCSRQNPVYALQNNATITGIMQL